MCDLRSVMWEYQFCCCKMQFDVRSFGLSDERIDLDAETKESNAL